MYSTPLHLNICDSREWLFVMFWYLEMFCCLRFSFWKTKLGCVVICINPAIKHETHSWVFPSLVSLILTHLSCTNVAMQAKWLIWNQELDLFSLVGWEQEKENFYPISCATVEQQTFFLEIDSRILKPVIWITAAQQQQQALSAFSL